MMQIAKRANFENWTEIATSPAALQALSLEVSMQVRLLSLFLEYIYYTGCPNKMLTPFGSKFL